MAHPHHSSSFAIHRSLKILVVDDDEVARQAIVELLESHGHEVTAASSPLGVTKQVLQEHYDVVVLDVVMPSMRGDTLAALLARHPRLQDLGVVLVTGEQRPDVVVEGPIDTVSKGDMRHALPAAVRRASLPPITARTTLRAPSR